MLSSTPDHLDIRPRRLNAALPDPLPRWWLGNDPFRTHFFNAMSVLFPDGEQFFIDSVRHFRDRVTDPALAQQIRGFIGQEAHHSREHIEYNQRLRDLGYDIDALERPVKQRIRWIHKNFSPNGSWPPPSPWSISPRSWPIPYCATRIGWRMQTRKCAACGAGTRWKRPNTNR